MKRSEQPAQRPSPAKPLRTQSAGLYGEVGVLPLARTPPTALNEPRSFL